MSSNLAMSRTKTSQHFAMSPASVIQKISNLVSSRGYFSSVFVIQSYLSTNIQSSSLQTFRRIFTGPGSVLNEKPGPPTKRKTNADIIGLEQVTPRSIAYAVVQVSSIFVLYAPHAHSITYSGASGPQ